MYTVVLEIHDISTGTSKFVAFIYHPKAMSFNLTFRYVEANILMYLPVHL